MTPRVLVAGIGNIFLADDGFGCEVVHRLAAEPLPDGAQVVDYGIRGVHLAYDLLTGYDGLVIVDAVPRGGSPGEITVLEVGPEDLGSGDLDAHGMEPVAVLGSLGALGGRLPRTLVVGCEPADIGERIGLSEPVSRSVEAAVLVVQELLDREFGLPPPSLARSAATTPFRSSLPSREEG